MVTARKSVRNVYLPTMTHSTKNAEPPHPATSTVLNMMNSQSLEGEHLKRQQHGVVKRVEVGASQLRVVHAVRERVRVAQSAESVQPDDGEDDEEEEEEDGDGDERAERREYHLADDAQAGEVPEHLEDAKGSSAFPVPLSALRLCSREDPEMAITSTTARKTMTKSKRLKPSAKKVQAPRPIILTATSTVKKKVRTKLVTTSARSSLGSMPWCSTAMSTVLR